MYLTRHQTANGTRWALDSHFLPEQLTLGFLLELPKETMISILSSLPISERAGGALLPPLEPMHEVWACGVTYLRSREAREAESETADVYTKVYYAERPEQFLKAVGWRVVGHTKPIRIRQDSDWNVPEPELTLVINAHQEIVGFCIGNDVSSREIEGENPLYLPQAKVYNGSCALGPGIRLMEAQQLKDIAIESEIIRGGKTVFTGQTRTSRIKRTFDDLVAYLTRELDFPQGVFLMTGTGLVPPDNFTLQAGDLVRITIDSLILENEVQAN
ncbi:MAG: fumarylacetoacetate hydrolase family protein [Ardenticatenaceae bacterium]